MRRIIFKVLSLFVVLAVILSSLCIAPQTSEAAGSVKIKSITLNIKSKTILAGNTYQLIATIKPSNATNQTLTWTSSNKNAAIVSDTGLVTAVAGGKTTITVKATDGSKKSAKCSIIVKQYVDSVTLNTHSISFTAKGKSYTLKATVLPKTASNKKVVWKSSDKKVATVSSSGKVSSKGSGTCTITCTAADGSGKSDSCIVYVSQVSVIGVTLNKDTLDLTTGQTETLTATINPSNASDKSVTWSSSDTGVATVDTNGTVTAVSIGSATITVKTNNGNKTDTCNVTVNEYLPDGDYYFYIKDGGKAMNLYADSDAAADKNGTKVTVWTPTGHTTQRFRVQNIGNNKCRITAISSINNGNSRALNLNRGSSTPVAAGITITLWQVTSSGDQDWIASKTADGYYKISPAADSNLAIGCDAPGTDGTDLKLQQYSGSAAQLWDAEIITNSNTTTFYWQHDPQWGLPAGGCWITSYAMVINNLGIPATPKTVYEANGNSVVANHILIRSKFGVKPVDLSQVSSYFCNYSAGYGSNDITNPGANAVNALKAALAVHPEGIMVRFNGVPHTMVAIGSSGNTIMFDDPAISNGCNITFEQTTVYKEGFRWKDVSCVQALKGSMLEF